MQTKAVLITSLQSIERALTSGAYTEVAEMGLGELALSLRSIGHAESTRPVRVAATEARRAMELGQRDRALRKIRLAIAYAQTEL